MGEVWEKISNEIFLEGSVRFYAHVPCLVQKILDSVILLNSFARSSEIENEKSQGEGFETLLLKTRQSGRAQMDWFRNITPGAGLEL